MGVKLPLVFDPNAGCIYCGKKPAPHKVFPSGYQYLAFKGHEFPCCRSCYYIYHAIGDFFMFLFGLAIIVGLVFLAIHVVKQL